MASKSFSNKYFRIFKSQFNFVLKVAKQLLIEEFIKLIIEVLKITKVTLGFIIAFEGEASKISIFNLNRKMAIVYKNEVRDVMNASNADKFRFNCVEIFSYK
jgi:hypothetical protein